MNVIAISSEFGIRPSEVVGMTTQIGKFCFDTAAVYFIRNLEDKKTPRYKGDEKKNPGLQTLLG